MRLYGHENDDQNSKQHFFFSLCIQIGHAMPACTHIVVPTFDTLLAELMVVHFTFHPFSNSLGKFFTRPQHSCQTSSMGLRINLGRLHQFPAQNFQRRIWETTTCTVAQNMRKKIKTRNLGRSLTAVFKSATKTQANAMLTVADWVSVISVIPKIKCSLICFF